MRTPGIMSVLRARLRDLASGDDGIALALALAFFMPAFMLIVCIYAVQETIWRKAQLQNAADAAAYSASVVQADYFNRIALVNKVLGWTYVDRERARMDYAMGKLVCRAEDVRKAELEVCRKENARACCGKRKIEKTYYGVGYSVPKDQIKYGAYPRVNGLERLPFQKFEQFVSARGKSSSKFFVDLEKRIRTDGERMKLCNKTLERLQKEMDVSVERAANDILELNMDQSGAHWFSRVFTPKTVTPSPVPKLYKEKVILQRLSCGAEDEKNLFEAAGFENADPKAVLGPGADKWLVLADSKRRGYEGPSYVGRDLGFCSSVPSVKEIFVVGLIAITVPFLEQAEALASLYLNEKKERPRDEKFAQTMKTRRSTGARSVPLGNSDGVGPNRVLDFGPDGNTYLSGDIDWFWKRYAKASYLFGYRHVCIYPLKIGPLRIGCHCKGSTRFSLYENGKNGEKGMRGGQPAYGDVVPANGLKITDDFFSEYGATRILVARENANPLRVFGTPSTAAKYSIVEEIRKIVLRFDSEGLFGVFNSHLGDSGFDKDGFEGPQRPNYMFALSASRIGYRLPDKKDYHLRRAVSEKRGAKTAWNLCCTDWEAFLVPFRSVKLMNWNNEAWALAEPPSWWKKLIGWIAFEEEMRGLEVPMDKVGWIGHEPKLDDNGRVTGYKKSPLTKSLEGLVTLLRMNDTRGPHPFKSGFTLLSWGLAEDYIQH